MYRLYNFHTYVDIKTKEEAYRYMYKYAKEKGIKIPKKYEYKESVFENALLKTGFRIMKL